MSDRTGFNKGAVLIDALRGETLDFALGASVGSANFAMADDQPQAVLDFQNFPQGQDAYSWKLKFSPTANQTVTITAVDGAGNQIGAYQRTVSVSDADSKPLPVYTTAFLFITAVGYTLKVRHLKKNGVVEQVADVQYKNGAPTDHDAAESIGIDFA